MVPASGLSWYLTKYGRDEPQGHLQVLLAVKTLSCTQALLVPGACPPRVAWGILCHCSLAGHIAGQATVQGPFSLHCGGLSDLGLVLFTWRLLWFEVWKLGVQCTSVGGRSLTGGLQVMRALPLEKGQCTYPLPGDDAAESPTRYWHLILTLPSLQI
jgi:hypothetical protein